MSIIVCFKGFFCSCPKNTFIISILLSILFIVKYSKQGILGNSIIIVLISYWDLFVIYARRYV